MISDFRLYDPLSTQRGRVLGGRRLGVLQGSDFDVTRNLRGATANIVGTDILRLDRLGLPYDVLHVTKNYFRGRDRMSLDKYDVLINTATNADSDAGVLNVMTKLLSHFRGRVINDPATVLRTTRDRVSLALADVPDLIAPSTVRIRNSSPSALSAVIEQGNISFPAILRKAGTHLGGHLAIVNREEEVYLYLKSCRRGSVLSHLYLTSFFDFKDSDGLYRKYRIFFIGDQPILRSMIVSDSWNVHTSERARYMTARPELTEQERRIVARGFGGLPAKTKAVLNEIRRRVGLDFFGIDFSVFDGSRVLLFEANATMNFFDPIVDTTKNTDFPLFAQVVPPARAAFEALLSSS